MAREHNLIIVTPSSLEFVALPLALSKAAQQQAAQQQGGPQQGQSSG
jgi:SPFH domain, Band 7 family protein